MRDPEIDRRLKEGPDLVSANFVIPYPPGFPIMVPGQVITQEAIDFMRKLDVKEIHGYEAAEGLSWCAAERAGRRDVRVVGDRERVALNLGIGCRQGNCMSRLESQIGS